MSDLVMEAARLMDMLPESDQNFAFEFIKKLVLEIGRAHVLNQFN